MPTHSIDALAQLRVVITAGASGIGRHIAQTFVAGGARVQICDVDAAALEDARSSHPMIGATRADVADEADVRRFFDAALSALGGLDVLVNNAGIAGPTGMLEDLQLADWQRTLDVNLTGQFLCARAAIPHLKAAGGGSIVNLSSAAGRFGFPGRSPYAASKWGVVGLTKTLAMELGPHNIRVNAVLPGAVDGPRIRRVIEGKAGLSGKPFDDVLEAYVRQSSLQRLIPPEDIASVVAFLCSPAGASISGQTLNVDGDTQSLT